MEIKSELLPIEKLSNYSFVNPKYHRNYVWDTKHVLALFKNMEDGYANSNPSKELKECFLGTITLNEGSDGYFEVIDGLQRLNTILLLLSVIRNNFSNYDNSEQLVHELREKIEILLFESNVDHKTIGARIKLPYDDSGMFFDSLITRNKYEGSISFSIQKMKKTYDLLSKKINQLSKDELVKFISYILVNVKFLVLIINNPKNYIMIPETIHPNSKKLNVVEGLKFILFKITDQEVFEIIHELWKDILKNLEECGELQNPIKFLKDFLLTYFNIDLQNNNILNYIISEMGEKLLNIKNNPLQFVQLLKNYSVIYKMI